MIKYALLNVEGADHEKQDVAMAFIPWLVEHGANVNHVMDNEESVLGSLLSAIVDTITYSDQAAEALKNSGRLVKYLYDHGAHLHNNLERDVTYYKKYKKVLNSKNVQRRKRLLDYMSFLGPFVKPR